MSVLEPGTPCLDNRNSVVSLEIGKCVSLNLALLFQDCCSVLDRWNSHMKFRVSLSVSAGNLSCCWAFDKDCVNP